MIVRIDARRLTDAAGMHAVLTEAFGFPPTYGKNLDALVDCLTRLDEPAAGLARVQVFPGQVVLIAIDFANGPGRSQATQLTTLMDVAAFVNWRRLEQGRPPILAVAYSHG
jgi:RNAse (barnase) inhibitor barstar